MTKKVWILCVPKDREFASVLKQRLSNTELVIEDSREIPLLGEGELELGLTGIRKADQIILLLSKNSIDDYKFNVQRMDAYISAVEKAIGYVLPVVVDGIVLDETHKSTVFANFYLDPEGAIQKLIDALVQGRSTTKQNTHSHIHILTSLKGGIGKTLTGLSVVSSYLNKNRPKLYERKLLVVDNNHMNIDLYGILRPFTKGSSTIKPPWQFASLRSQKSLDRLILARASGEGFQLPLGARGFWERLNGLVSLHEGYDAIVDTNLNFANLINGLTVDELSSILERPDTIYYFWVFWTFASISTARDVLDKRLGAENLLIDVWNLLPLEQKNRVRFIHVLNPAGMVTLQPDQSIVDKLVATASYVMNVSKRTHDLHLSVQDGASKSVRDSYVAQTSELLKKVDNDLSNLVTQFVDLNTKPRSIDGLRAFRACPVKGRISLEEFVNIVSSFISQHKESPDYLFENKYDGFYNLFHNERHVNFFPITTYVPSLRGYTDRLAINPVSRLLDIRKQTRVIEDDIGPYLEQLITYGSTN